MKKNNLPEVYTDILLIYLKKGIPFDIFFVYCETAQFSNKVVSSHLFLPHTLPLLTSHLRSEDQNLT